MSTDSPVKTKIFDKAQFLEKGALFAYGGQVAVMWGDYQEVPQRPDSLAIQERPFFKDEPISWRVYSHSLLMSCQEFFEQFPESIQKNRVEWKVADQSLFSKQFEWVQELIEKKEITKAVPYIFEEGELLSPQNLFIQNLFYSVSDSFKGYLYGSWDEKGGRLGLTPEVLIEMKERSVFETMAVAGTTSLENFNQEEFFQNKKENEEHDWVVEDIKDVLSEWGDLSIGDREIVTTPHLAHLKTFFRLNSKKATSFEKLIDQLHPTPALGGYPRSSGLPVMQEIDQWCPRKAFGAPFSFSCYQDEAVAVVAIRNIEWEGTSLKLGSGCGVVADSVLDKEWEELFHKRRSVKRIFGLS